MVREKEAMKGEMDRRVVYGGEDLVLRIKKEYGMEAVTKPKGRPKKERDY